MSEQGYTRDQRSTVIRLKERGRYDYQTIHDIIDRTQVLHVSFPPGEDDFPVILPMIGCTGAFEVYGKSETPDSQAGPGSFPEDSTTPAESSNIEKTIYLHGSAVARLFKAPKEERIPVCVAATLVQGNVLALSPFHNSNNYASAVVHGYASIITDEAERTYALTRITDNILPERWANSRTPSKPEMTATGVIRVDIVSASAKVRTGSAHDDKPDIKNESLVNSCWTGVIPSWTMYGEPVESDHNKVKRVPGYISEWIQKTNAANKKEAEDAAIEPDEH